MVYTFFTSKAWTVVCSTTQAYKVDVPNSNTKTIWINIFEWYVVRRDLKTDTKKMYVQKRLDYMLNTC